MIPDSKLKGVLTAVQAAERAPWAVVDSLVDAIPYENGHAVRGATNVVADYIVKNGEGDRYSENYIQQLRRLGELIGTLKGNQQKIIRSAPLRMAIFVVVEKKATLTPEQAIEYLVKARNEGWTLRKLSEMVTGEKWSGGDTDRLPQGAREKVAREEMIKRPSFVAKHVATYDDAARAIARNKGAREAVETHGVQARVTENSVYPKPDIKEVTRRVDQKLARSLKSDLATDALRQAAGALGEAILAKEQWGIRYPAEEALEITRIQHYLAVYTGQSDINTEDREWLSEQGIEVS